MTAPYPIGYTGDGITRGLTLALPVSQVRRLLPPGLDLGGQDVTPPGTHPVILQFHDYSRCRLSVPTLLPDMAYREQTLGIPYLSVSAANGFDEGPYFFMPQLYLDHSFVTLAGFAFWGFTKTMACVDITSERYTVASLTGNRLASLAWKTADNGYRPPAAYSEFEPVRRMLSQPLITMLPAGAGPFRVLTDFHRDWDVATLRPLRTVLEIDAPYAPGFASGRYPESDWSEGIDASVLGSFELCAPWWLSFPYSPLISRGPRNRNSGD